MNTQIEPNYSDFNARKNGTYGKIWIATGKCVFCDLKDKYIIKKGKLCALTVNLFPYIDGQMLVTPFRHVEDFIGLTKEEWNEMQELSELAVKLIRKEFKHEEVWFNLKAPGGFKACKTVPHLHMNIMPYNIKLVAINPFDINISPLDLAEKYRNASNQL